MNEQSITHKQSEDIDGHLLAFFDQGELAEMSLEDKLLLTEVTDSLLDDLPSNDNAWQRRSRRKRVFRILQQRYAESNHQQQLQYTAVTVPVQSVAMQVAGANNHHILGTFDGLLPRHIIRQREQRLLTIGLLLTDACIIAISFALSYVIRFQAGLELFGYGSIQPDFYALMISLLLPGYVLLFRIYGLYDRQNLLGGTTEYARMFNAVTTGLALMIFLNFIQPDFVVARAWLLLSWVLMLILGISNRFVMRHLVYWQRQSGRFVDRTLIIGANPEGIAVAEQLHRSNTSGALMVGFIDDYLPIGFEPIPGVPVLGNSAAFASLVELQSIETVVIANTSITRERLLGIYGALDVLQDVEVRLASGLFELLTSGVRVREEGHVPLVVLNKTRITGIHLLYKTMLDYVCALMVLVVLLPIFPVMAYLIKRDSPGPVFYRRRVVGQGKREFDAFKFRTMRIEGNRLLSPEQRSELEEQGKLKDDPRITRAGNFLRRYGLDELPQLVNVLRGEMSLIGPRMITTHELAKFGKWQHNLATVKPGLTGLWQISGRSDLSYEEQVNLDMRYLMHHSIWLDLKILLQTISVLLSRRGAY